VDGSHRSVAKVKIRGGCDGDDDDDDVDADGDGYEEDLLSQKN